MRAENTITTVLGQKGMGKTVLTKEIILEHARVIVIDSTGEYDEEIGCVPAEGIKAATEFLVRYQSLHRFCLSYRPATDEEALRFLDLCYEVHHYLLVIDEANIYMAASSLPTPIANLVRRGRHREISQIYCAQRASSIHREVTSASDVIVAFRQHEARDVEYLRREGFGERAEVLPTLQVHQALVYAPDPSKIPLAVHRREV